MRTLRRNGPRAIMLLGLLTTISACSGVYVANQVAARAGSGLDSQDRDDIDAGNIGAVRDRYGAFPVRKLPLRQHALLCDIYLKYQELGRAGECLDAVAARLATEPDNTIAR